MGSISEQSGAQAASTLDRANDLYIHNKIQDLFSLKGRTTVITGGARGIGLALAFAVAEAGSNVAILDISDQPHEHFHLLQNGYGVKVKLYKSDITKYDVLKASFDQIVKDFGRVDCLITAAGICPDAPFLERSPESVARTFEINVLGSFYAAQCAAAQMVKQDENEDSESQKQGGSILMIASVAAYQASKMQYLSDYCSSKGAIVSLVRELGVELAERGIRVNSISPGYMMTDMTLSISDTRPALARIFVTEPPMRRMGDRTDLKGAAVYLLSDASAYTTGEDILITGGMHAGRTHLKS